MIICNSNHGLDCDSSSRRNCDSDSSSQFARFVSRRRPDAPRRTGDKQEQRRRGGGRGEASGRVAPVELDARKADKRAEPTIESSLDRAAQSASWMTTIEALEGRRARWQGRRARDNGTNWIPWRVATQLHLLSFQARLSFADHAHAQECDSRQASNGEKLEGRSLVVCVK